MSFRIICYKNLESKNDYEVVFRVNKNEQSRKPITQKLNQKILTSGILEIQFYQNHKWNNNNLYFEYDLFYVHTLTINVTYKKRKYRIAILKDSIVISSEKTNVKTNSVLIPLAIMKRMDGERNVIYGNDFPKDILITIFKNLPWKTLIDLTTVCYRWREIVFESSSWSGRNIFLTYIPKPQYAMFLFENRSISHKLNSITLPLKHMTIKSTIDKPFNDLINVYCPLTLKEPIYVKKITLEGILKKEQFLDFFRYFPITTKAKYMIEEKGGGEDEPLYGSFDLNNQKKFREFTIPNTRIMTPLGLGYIAGNVSLGWNNHKEETLLFLLDSDKGASYWSGLNSYEDYTINGFHLVNEE